jgi:hypothetical protein
MFTYSRNLLHNQTYNRLYKTGAEMDKKPNNDKRTIN